MYFNDLVCYISGFLKFWDLPNFGGLKPLLKWLYGWAGSALLFIIVLLFSRKFYRTIFPEKKTSYNIRHVLI